LKVSDISEISLSKLQMV